MNITRTATGCYGVATSGIGLNVTGTATGCHGLATSGTGLNIRGSATGCVGSSGTGTGLNLAGRGTASGCLGESTNAGGAGGGLRHVPGNSTDVGTAMNSIGIAAGSGVGLSATLATNCDGRSATGSGLTATNATNCNGMSGGGNSVAALRAFSIAIGCRGQSTAAATGLEAFIANSSRGSSVSGTPEVISFKYDMP